MKTEQTNFAKSRVLCELLRQVSATEERQRELAKQNGRCLLLTARGFFKSKGRHRKGGFSLVEVVLSFAILAIGVTCLFGLLQIGVAAWGKGEDLTAKILIVEDAIAYFQSLATDKKYYSTDPQFVISPEYSYHENKISGGRHYGVACDVLPVTGSDIVVGQTNMVTRVQIAIWGTTGFPLYRSTQNTNYYFTECARLQ